MENKEPKYISVATVFEESQKQGLFVALSDQEKVKHLHNNKPNTHKAPQIAWDKQPKDYSGNRNDPKYGTAIRGDYIESIDRYYVVIDLDTPKSKPPKNIPIEILKRTCEPIFKQTRTYETPSGGIHIHLLSKEKPKADQPSCNIDYQTNTSDNSKGKYFVSDWRWSADGTVKEYYNPLPNTLNEIACVENSDDVLNDIIGNLIKSGYITTTPKTIFDGLIEPIETVIVDDGWTHNLTGEEVIELVELIKPIYIRGQRQYTILWLTGWMRIAEVNPESASKVINLLSQEDIEKGVRVTALKNSYEKQDNKHLKGSSGIYQLLKNHYEINNPKSKDSGDLTKTAQAKFDRENKKRIEHIEKSTKQHYGKIANIIVNRGSTLGITNRLQKLNIYTDKALRELKRFLETRFKPILDYDTKEIYIYDSENGFYKQYDDEEFLKFISNLFPNFDFFKENTNKVKSGISNLRKEDSEYISFKNGLLNTNTLEFSEHTSKIFTKAHISYAYTTEAKSELMDKTLRDILIDKSGDNEGDESKYKMFHQLVGYIFKDGNPHNLIFFIHGEGANGKSVLMTIIKAIFQEYAVSVPLHQFNDTFGLEPLIGKKVDILYDLPRIPLKDLGKLKALTGEDYMTIQRKFKGAWNGKPGIKIIGMGNHLPLVHDTSDGFWRRVGVIELVNTFKGHEKDPYRGKKLTEDNNAMEYLINKSIHAYKEVENGEPWAIPIGDEDSKENYLKKSNPCLYGAMQLYEHSLDAKDYVTREEVVKEVSEILRVKDLEIPANNKTFYDALRIGMGGEDGETKKNEKTIRVIRMIKRKESKLSNLNMELKVKRNHNQKIITNETNPMQRSIINALGIGKYAIKDLITEITGSTDKDYRIILDETEELINQNILLVEEEKN